MIDLKKNVWYRAIDIHGDSEWYNVFLEMDNNRVKYISTGPLDASYFFFELVNSTSEEFEEEISGNFVFKRKEPSARDSRKIIKGVFK